MMKICYDYKDCVRDSSTVLTVGTFDGVHAGHRRIIETLKSRAAALQCRSCLVTFNPHPQQIVKKEGRKNIGILTPLEEKINFLNLFDIDIVVVIPFTTDFSLISAEEFVHDNLLKYIGIKEIVVGHDHAFGKGRTGTIENLKAFGIKWGFGVTVVSPLMDSGIPVSSTRIRSLIENGDFESAQRYLCRPYQISGKVVHGNARGKSLTYPTANVVLDNPDKISVPDGIYICEAVVGGITYQGMMSVGYRPTFEERIHTIEVHILNFNRMIYDEQITIKVLRFLREELKFKNEKELIARMDKDRDETVAYFNSKPEIECLA